MPAEGQIDAYAPSRNMPKPPVPTYSPTESCRYKRLGAELDVLVATFDLGRRNNLAYPKALHLMVKAILAYLKFPFITPAGEAESNAGIVPLDDHQLASRLSYRL